MRLVLSFVLLLTSPVGHADQPAPVPSITPGPPARPADPYVAWRRASFDAWLALLLPPGEHAVTLRARARAVLDQRVNDLAQSAWYATHHGRAGNHDAAFNARIDEHADQIVEALRALDGPAEARREAFARVLETVVDAEALIMAYTPGRKGVMVTGSLPLATISALLALFIFFGANSTQSPAVKEMILANTPLLLLGDMLVAAAVPASLATFGLGRRLLLKLGRYNGVRGGGMLGLENRLWARVADRIEADDHLRSIFGTPGAGRQSLATRLIYLTDVPAACEAWLDGRVANQP